MDRRGFGLWMGAAGLGLSLGAGRAARAEASTTGEVERVLAQTGAPALAGVVVTRDGVQRLEAAGVRRLGAADRVATTDQWHLGSNTKAMTAALYGVLVQEGRAKWGASLAALFPTLKLDPAFAGATVEQLMSHHAGISDKAALGPAWLMAAHRDTRSLPVQRLELAQAILTRPPAGKPGAFEYANANFILAGAAIEQIAGQPWETVITERLFKPLGLASAGFGAPTGASPWGHRPGPDGALVPVDPAGVADNPAALGPAGRVHMSLPDYATWLQEFLGKPRVLKPETVAHLTAPAEGGDQSYAQGWLTFAQRPWAHGPALAHEGSNTMWHCMALVAPARGVAVATVSNSEAKGAQACQALGLEWVKGLGA